MITAYKMKFLQIIHSLKILQQLHKGHIFLKELRISQKDLRLRM